jgi:hypothetical protein
MAAASFAHETTIWTDGRRAPLAGAIATAMGEAVSVLGVGGPREAAVDELGRELDRPRVDDLRKLLVDRPARYLLLTTLAGVTRQDLVLAGKQQTTVLLLEPVAASLAELTGLGLSVRGEGAGKANLPWMVTLPSFLEGPGFSRAADPTESLGARRLISFHSFGQATEGSLLARLVDGWRTVLHFGQLPESVDASLADGGTVPDDPRQASGRLATHARMPDGSAAVLAVSDQAGQRLRRLEAIGEAAQLTVADTDYALWQTTGELIDDHREANGEPRYIELIVTQWQRLMQRTRWPRDPIAERDQARALACCEACLLSARTGQPENPRKLIEMHR